MPTDGVDDAAESGRGGNQSSEDLFHVEYHSNHPRGETPGCADCGTKADLIGPFSFDGDVMEGGDMVCAPCAEERGADLKYCTCGVPAYLEGGTCPGCRSYLGGGSRYD